jgi:hypothetical protein
MLDFKGQHVCPLLAPNGHADCIARCPLSGAKRKTYPRIELFRFGPEPDVTVRRPAVIALSQPGVNARLQWL